MKSFGQTIRERRKDLGITLVELGKDIELTQGYLSNIENDNRTPTPQVIKKLADALDMRYQFLMKVAGFIEEEPFGERLMEHIKEVNDQEDAVERIAEAAEIPLSEMEGLLEGSQKPSPVIIERLAKALGNVSYSQLLLEAGYDLEAKKESMRQLLMDFGNGHGYEHYDRARLLEEALDLKQLLEGSREDFQKGEVVPFYNGHLLTESDRKRLANIIKEVFPEYEEPGTDHEEFQTRWITTTDIE